MKAKLHHFAYNIKPNKLAIVIELFEKLGCNLSYREGQSRWCMIEQKPLLIDIQIIETKDKVVPIETKINTHIGFISNNPTKDIKEIASWAEDKKIKFKQGSWSEKELWFDLPDIFTNFVIEIMEK